MTAERESIDDLIERVTVDAYGDEGHEAFLCAFDDEVAYPTRAKLAGTDVDVTRIGYDGNARRGLIADMETNGNRHHVALLELGVQSNGHFGELVAASVTGWANPDS
jgi:hypothetical protein